MFGRRSRLCEGVQVALAPGTCVTADSVSLVSHQPTHSGLHRRPYCPHSCAPCPLRSPRVTVQGPRHVQNQVCLPADLRACRWLWARCGTSLLSQAGGATWYHVRAMGPAQAGCTEDSGGCQFSFHPEEFTCWGLWNFTGGCVQEAGVHP